MNSQITFRHLNKNRSTMQSQQFNLLHAARAPEFWTLVSKPFDKIIVDSVEFLSSDRWIFSHLKNCDKCSPKGIEVAAWNLVVVYIEPCRKRKWIRKHQQDEKGGFMFLDYQLSSKEKAKERTNEQTSKRANDAMKRKWMNGGRNDRQNARTKARMQARTNARTHKRTKA